MHTLVVLAVLVYAPPSGKAGGPLAEVAQALKRAVRASGGEVLDSAIERGRAEHARGWVEEARLRFFQEARALAEEGRRALERVELARAEAALDKAEALYLPELQRPGVAALMSAVALDRGRALYDQGHTQAALQAFRRARALDPAAQLTEATVRPVVARAFQGAVLPPKAQGPLTLIATTPGATGVALALTVDGQPWVAGDAPIVVATGPHLVRAAAAGRLPVARLVEVTPEGARVELPLSADPDLEALAELRARPTRPGAVALARALGLDGVLAVAVGVDRGVTTLVGQRYTNTGCTTAVETEPAAGSLDRAADALARRLAAARDRCDAPPTHILEAPAIAHPRPAPTPISDKPKPRKPKFYERPWLWAGLLAVTSVAVGVTAALVTREPTFQASLEGRRFSTLIAP
ncbi:MAG TPA: tetratricopeptide repeat protein [Kofleriaceae bacterium]|nr:tetratricopeptide repeat protein [Kofleriaceae bacterium]